MLVKTLIGRNKRLCGKFKGSCRQFVRPGTKRRYNVYIIKNSFISPILKGLGSRNSPRYILVGEEWAKLWLIYKNNDLVEEKIKRLKVFI